MGDVHLIMALLAAVVLLSLAARPLHVPHAVVLVIGGIGLGALPFVPDARLDPDLILLAFLPPILFPSALAYAREDVLPELRAIGFLALGLVVATSAAVAVVAHLALGVPWAAAWVLGAVLGPTDPVSATAVLRAAGAPQRIATILEGESLINDGTALTLFRIALAAVGAAFVPASAALDFVTIAIGGAVAGAAIGWLVSELLRRIEDVEVESAIAVLTAYGSYVLAEEIHVSGILATVLAGYVIGRRLSEISSPETRLRSGSFWALIQFLSETMLFVLVGVVFADSFADEQARSVPELIGITLLVTAVVGLTRLAWMFTVPYLLGLVDPKGRSPSVPPAELLVLVLGGMRGAVSVAVALAIPATVEGTPFPERDAIVVIALGSVALLLIGPALALPPVLRGLGLDDPDAQAHRLARARIALAEAALDRASELEERRSAPEDLLARARALYEGRLAGLRHEVGDGDGHGREDGDAAYRHVLRQLLDAEWRTLRRLESERDVTGDALRRLERDLDLETRRLR
ncbi:MAG: Na+/H+ antiporter [Gemmatimonadaceae bacterium]